MKPTTADRVTRHRMTAAEAMFELENGARMDQPTFHKLYQQTPEGFRAQLIGGVVYVMASPVSPRHARPHLWIGHWLCLYTGDTPGVEGFDNVTNILGADSEPQPDVCLVVQADYGGRAVVTKDAVVGPPDLVVEIALSSRTIDLGQKKSDYEKAGVGEYLVIRVVDETAEWYRRGPKGFINHLPGADGIFRSELFPGLWLDPKTLFEPTVKPLVAVSRKGLASPEHAAFVAALAARKRRKKK